MGELELRLGQIEARQLALGQFAGFLMRRLGADDPSIRAWWAAWQGGDTTRLIAAQNEIIGTLKAKAGSDPRVSSQKAAG